MYEVVVLFYFIIGIFLGFTVGVIYTLWVWRKEISRG